MTCSRLATCIIFVLLTFFTAPAQARDWFVKAGSTGDGSKEKPFSDPFEALEKCEANDAIHIAEGRYAGKLQAGEWTIPFEGVQLLGGYNADFTQRDPWKFKTMLVWDKNSKNQPKDERIIATVRGVVLDGLVIDEREQNEYDDKGRTQKSLSSSTAAVRLTLPSTVKNCVFVNTGRQAVVTCNGSTLENNLFLNTFDSAVKINGLPPANDEAKKPAIIKNNTFAWSWDDRAAGKGGYQGSGVYATGPVTITGNIFAHCDNSAVYITAGLDRCSVTNNVFFMNLWSNFKSSVDGKAVTVDDKTMDLFEEAGLKAFEGNISKNPGLPLDKNWMEATTKRTSLQNGKLEMDDWNKLRQTMGMDLKGGAAIPASGIAPVYDVDKALALMTPADNSIKAGARTTKLEPKFSGNIAAGPAKSYEKSDITTWARKPGPMDGKDLEMTVAISSVGNISAMSAKNFKTDDYEGIKLHDQNGDVMVVGFYKKGSSVNRTVNEGANRYTGSGKADRLYTVKGTAYASGNWAYFLLDSIAPLEATAIARTRAKGRDWFVRAGSSGGDGSKEKPFKDPYQPLERCEAGDTIHVTGGDYVGKLRAGTWKVDCPDITMLGGYDKDFTTRDPWKNPTLLYCPEDFKGTRGGYTLQGEDDHTGFVLDGFVFDKKLNNTYDSKGDLTDNSDHSEHLWLAKPGCVVRNCVFLNGCEGAVRLSSAQTIENNIFLNHGKWVVKIQRAFNPEVPTIFKDNTCAFAWEKRFGQGNGLTGDLLMIDTDVHAVVDNNIFEFADQQAIRINSDPKGIELTNNVFAHNLWADIYQARDRNIIDAKTFDKLSQMGWKKCEGNIMAIPGLPLDQKWFDVYMNRTAMTPGKVEMDDWNKLREMIGQPMIATGGKAGEGFAPAYDRKLAMTLFPRNDKIKAGARPKKLEVKFEGVAKTQETHEYADTTWDVARDTNEWAKLDGKRVALKVAIKSGDTQFALDDIKKDQYSSWQVGGPEGSNSPGLPMRVYTPSGTRIERAFKQAKGYSSGAVAETHIIRGIARGNRQMVVEVVERAD